MGYINPPAELPQGMAHATFYSRILGQQTGYTIYLPPGYREGGESCPAVYHIHGWQGNESSEIWPMARVCRARPAITVFMNAISLAPGYFDALLQIESVFIGELIPHIEGRYRAVAAREGRALSGFSMGGAMAFYYAAKHPGLFGGVTAYAGTYHHQYHEGYDGVGKPASAAAGLYEGMMREERYLEARNILCLVRQNAAAIRENLRIALHIGTDDILLCDNEILHLYLGALRIPHEYKRFDGAAHDLEKIL